MLNPSRIGAGSEPQKTYPLAGWTSSKIAEAFGVREDTVRLEFARIGIDVADIADVAVGVAREFLIRPSSTAGRARKGHIARPWTVGNG
jgi:hypothetical protein